MARDPRTFLGQFLLESQQRNPSPADVAYVLKTMVRELFPSGHEASQRCPQAVVFADWIVHGTLERSASGRDAMARIAEAMARHGEHNRATKWLEEEVNGGISFSALRLDLLAIARHHGLPEAWFASWDRWKQFGRVLAFEVSGRPVVLGQGGAASKARNRMQKTSLEARHHPASIMVILDSAGKPWWQIETVDSTLIRIQTLLGGYRLEDFPTPAGWRSPFDQPDPTLPCRSPQQRGR